MSEYDLNDVRKAANQANIEYRGRKVMRDTANLGYELTDVADCISKLTTSDFRKTHVYDNAPPGDEYICHYIKTKRENEFEDNLVDELYVKFCLIDGCLLIDLGSFHLTRFS